jgi:hypothetical protein
MARNAWDGQCFNDSDRGSLTTGLRATRFLDLSDSLEAFLDDPVGNRMAKVAFANTPELKNYHGCCGYCIRKDSPEYSMLSDVTDLIR